MDLFDRIEELLASQFGDAPRQLKHLVQLALLAIGRRQFGEALNKLRQADALVEESRDELADWRAEVATTWALYYCRGGPELKRNAMWRKIREAQRLEPENGRLMEVIELIRAERGQ